MQRLNIKSKPVLFLALVILYFFVLLLGTAPSQTSAASGFTCDSTKDYGNTCIDTTGKPRCKAPYSEQCGPSCSRQITCGNSGEFKAGECTCANQNQTTDSPATGNIVQKETPTCPVATIWDGTTCKGTAVGTDYETKDQPPRENGGNIVADNGQHGGQEISRQEGNNLGAGGGGGGGGGGFNSGSSDADESVLSSEITNCINKLGTTVISLASVNSIFSCPVGDFVYSGTIADLRAVANGGDASSLNITLSQSALDRCVARDDQANGIVRCTIDGVLVANNAETFRAAAQGDQAAIGNFRIALQADQNGNGEDTASDSESNSLAGQICQTVGEVTGSFICKAGWFQNNVFYSEADFAYTIANTNDPNNKIYCNNEDQYNKGRIGYPEMSDTLIECKRIWVENTQSSGFHLFPKASAQTLPPVPELVDIDNLTPGKYLISIPGFKTAEFTVGNEQVQITFFNDTNGNGTQDANEPTINPKDFATSISKTESIYTINLNLGWNLINLPVANSVIKKASDLSDYIRLTGGDVYQISTYQSGNWVHYVSRINDENEITEFGSDFNIVPGQSYFINSARRSQFRISGNDFLEQPPINLQNGWNLVGFPAETIQKASEILRYCKNFGTTCQTIAKFVDGVYETVVDDLGTIFGNDFQIQKTEGYFILNEGKEGVVRW